MMKAWRDKFLSRGIIGSIVIVCLLICSGYMFITYKFKEYQNEEFLKYANVIGAAIRYEGNIDKVVDSTVKGELLRENIEVGIGHLNNYGYFEGMDIENKWIGQTFMKIRNLMLKISMLFSICIILLASYIIYGLIKRINVISDKLEKLSIGKEFTYLEETEDGFIGLLHHRYNLSCSRMKWWIDELKEERNKLKELLSELAHQLKTPIASIKMNNELILEGYVDKAEEKEFLRVNNENIDRMEWITTGLIKLSSLESKCIKLNKRNESLNETLIDSINAVYGKALEKNIKIEILKLDSIYLIHDKRWLGEAIINILDNSIKYSLQNKSIEVMLKNKDSKIELKIKDEGYGIKKEEINKIFSRFYRGINKEIQNEEGSGIGLYLSKKIIIEHEGVLKVKSSYGVGSEFTIILYKHLLD